MRSNYNDEEQAALKDLLGIMAAETNRAVQLLVAYLHHLETCAEAEHRVECAKLAKATVLSILTTWRYCAWIEAELAQGRAYADPVTVLAEFTAQQERLVKEWEEKKITTAAAERAGEIEAAKQQLAEAEKVLAEAAAETPAPIEAPAVQEPVVFTLPEQFSEMDKLATVPFPQTRQ